MPENTLYNDKRNQWSQENAAKAITAVWEKELGCLKTAKAFDVRLDVV
jgi:hypothetical protein